MRARSALFDLYGDHLRSRGGVAPVAALVRLLGALEIAPPAVRTAVSRMVRQGWLAPVRLGAGPGYALTPRAVRRLDDAAARIYRTEAARRWDGRWHLLVVTPPAGKRAGTRLAADLAFLGYGALDATTWISPRAADELAAVLATHGARAEAFDAVHLGQVTGSLLSRAWDLGALSAGYARFVAELTPVVGGVRARSSDEAAFAARSRLVHAWRNFLFVDPGLPADLLPADWAGARAAAFFDREAARLLPAAARHVDACLATNALPSGVTSLPSRR